MITCLRLGKHHVMVLNKYFEYLLDCYGESEGSLRCELKLKGTEKRTFFPIKQFKTSNISLRFEWELMQELSGSLLHQFKIDVEGF